MKEKGEKQVSENGNKILFKGPKLGVVIVVGVLLVILLGMQVFASTNGYGNVFFMIKELITTGSLQGEKEIFSDKEITLSYKSIDIADGVKLQANKLEIKENESTLCLHITAEDSNKVLPLKYEIMSEGMKKTEVKGANEVKGDFDERLTVKYAFVDDELMTLFVKDKDGNLLRELEINLGTHEIYVKGESEVEKISQIELKKYLNAFSRLNNDSEKVGQVIQIAYDIHAIALPDRLDAPGIEEMNEAIKEFYGDKVTFEKVKDEAGNEGEIFKLDGKTPKYSLKSNVYSVDEDLDNIHQGICLKIEDVKYEDEIYTVKYIYTLATAIEVADEKIEELPQYEATIKLKRNENAKYSKYQVVELSEGKEIEEKVSTKVSEDVQLDFNLGDNENIIAALEEGRFLVKNNIADVYEIKYLKITDNMYFVNVSHKDHDAPISVVTSFVAVEKEGKVVFSKVEEGKDFYDKYIDVDNKIIKAERIRREACQDVFYDISNGEYTEKDNFIKPLGEGNYLLNGNEITEKEYNEKISIYNSNTYIEFDKNATVLNISSNDEAPKSEENVTGNTPQLNKNLSNIKEKAIKTFDVSEPCMVKYEYDFNKDGNNEKLTLIRKDYDDFKVYCNNELSLDEFRYVDKVYIADLDENDNSIDLVFAADVASDDWAFIIYKFNENTFEQVTDELIDGEELYMDGQGTVLVQFGAYVGTDPIISNAYLDYKARNYKELNADKLQGMLITFSNVFFTEDLNNISKYHEYAGNMDFYEAIDKANIKKYDSVKCYVRNVSTHTDKIEVELEDGTRGYLFVGYGNFAG